MVNVVTFSPDGKHVVAGYNDKTLIIWNVTMGQQIQELEGHSGRVYSIVFSPDGKQMVSYYDDQTLCIWNVVATSQEITKMEAAAAQTLTPKDLLLESYFPTFSGD